MKVVTQLALVALIATGVCSYVIGRYLVKYGDLSEWRETTALVRRSSLIEASRWRRFGRVISLRCTYKYEWNGREYEGHTIAPVSLGDQKKRDWHALLSGHQLSSRPIPCYVNPAQPSRTVLSRAYSIADLGWYVAALVPSVAFLIVYFLRWPPWRFDATESG
ncbi:MAG TPA: DUF3592 domain-containing protein [Phycisphaerae bacterium]|nr:DUF3592 domain-containing protein [Phycisphaerae bacterium]